MWLFNCYHKSLRPLRLFFFFGGGIRNCLKNLCVFKNRFFCYFQSWKLQYLVIFLVELSTILWWTFVQSKASGIGIAAGERMVHVLWIVVNIFASLILQSMFLLVLRRFLQRAAGRFSSNDLVNRRCKWVKERRKPCSLGLSGAVSNCQRNVFHKAVGQRNWKISFPQKKGKETAGWIQMSIYEKSLVTKHLPKIFGQSDWWLGPFLAEVVGHGRVVVQQWLRVGPQGLRFDKQGLIFVRILVDPGSNLRFVHMQSSHFKVEYVVNRHICNRDTILRNSLKA